MATSSISSSGIRSALWEAFWTIGVSVIIAAGIRYGVAQTFTVQGTSMKPTFHTGNRLLVNKLAFVFGQPHTGEIIVFHSPVSPGQDWIKRVIGVPGDTVSIKNNVVYINGKRYPEPFLKYRQSMNVAPIKVPPGYLWVLGDNRPVSYDSRYWGLLPERDVIGQAIWQWWPVTQMRGV